MAIQYDEDLRTAKQAAIEAEIGESPVLKIFTGNPPEELADADTGTLLVEITAPSDWLADASGGTVNKTGTWSDLVIVTGTAGYFRFYDSAARCWMQGTVTLGVGDGDMTMSAVDLEIGQTVTVNAFTLMAGNA